MMNGTVEIVETGERIKVDRYQYHDLIRNILNNTQLNRYYRTDAVFSLSKKAEAFLKDYIESLKGKKVNI